MQVESQYPHHKQQSMKKTYKNEAKLLIPHTHQWLQNSWACLVPLYKTETIRSEPDAKDIIRIIFLI